MDVTTAMTRAIAVLGATLLVSTALKDKHKPRIPSPTERNTVVGDFPDSHLQPVKKDVVAKIIRFLKDFSWDSLKVVRSKEAGPRFEFTIYNTSIRAHKTSLC